MLVHTTEGPQHLFPLNNVITSISGVYFLSADEKVWSNRGGKTAIRLTGSKTKNGACFKFGSGRFGTTYHLNDIVRMSKAHKRWASETAQTSEPVKTAAPGKKIKEVDVNTAIKARGSIIGRVHKGHLVFGSAPKIHLTTAELKEEMLRLAAKYPGVKFVQLNIAAAVQSGGVTWE